ncbi:hypothetical protein SLS62_008759 [Diatrype stigma]|uniref:Uncharacterized protein n=1 Tax=Diatrype stigma TaxID=117547 RepID=A0AAN9UTM4_9PEZI
MGMILRTIPEATFKYEYELQIGVDLNKTLRMDIATRDEIKEVIFSGDLEFKDSTSKKNRRWHINAITGKEDSALTRTANTAKEWWFEVLENFPPRVGDPSKVVSWCAKIRLGVEVSESIPYGVLTKILEEIQNIRVDCNYDPSELTQTIYLGGFADPDSW